MISHFTHIHWVDRRLLLRIWDNTCILPHALIILFKKTFTEYFSRVFKIKRFSIWTDLMDRSIFLSTSKRYICLVDCTSESTLVWKERRTRGVGTAGVGKVPALLYAELYFLLSRSYTTHETLHPTSRDFAPMTRRSV